MVNPHDHDDPLRALGSALACALIAQILSVIVAAVLASQLPGGYRVQSWVFLGVILWTVAGTVVLLVRTAGKTNIEASGPSARRPRLRPRQVLLWLLSSWVWPLLLHRRR